MTDNLRKLLASSVAKHGGHGTWLAAPGQPGVFLHWGRVGARCEAAAPTLRIVRGGLSP